MQAGFFKDFAAGGFDFGFIALHMSLGEAVCAALLLYDDIEDLSAAAGEYDGSAGVFPVHVTSLLIG